MLADIYGDVGKRRNKHEHVGNILGDKANRLEIVANIANSFVGHLWGTKQTGFGIVAALSKCSRAYENCFEGQRSWSWNVCEHFRFFHGTR